MNFDDRKELTNQQKEFIDILKKEKEIFLIQLNEIVEKQKDDLDNLHKNIIKQVDHIEDSFNLNILSTLKNSQEDKYKGFIVDPGKNF